MMCAWREAGARRPAPSTPAGSRADLNRAPSAHFFGLLPAIALLLGAFSLFTAAPALAQAPTVTISSALTVSESTPADSTIFLSPVQSSDVTVGLTYAAGTATQATGNSCESGADYVAAPTSVTVPAGSTQKGFSIALCRDLAIESDETFTVAVASGTGYTVGTSSTLTVTITDGTFAVSLNAFPNPVTEGSTVTVTATRSDQGPAVSIPVTLTAGTAESGDYGALTSISILVGDTSGTGTITTTADSDSEDETFTVGLGSNLPSWHAAGSPSSVQVTITDGTPISLRVSPGNARLDLSWSERTTATGYDVHYTSAAESAAGNEESASGSNPATAWVAVTRSGTTRSQTISSLNNGTTYRVRVRVSDSGGGPWVFGTGTPAPKTVTLSVASTTVTEPQDVTVTYTLSKAIGSGGPITGRFLAVTATRVTSEANDHDASKQITVSRIETRGTFDFPIYADADQEDETFTLALTRVPLGYSIGSPSSVTITILDKDRPSVSLSASPNPVHEGDPVTVTASLSLATANALTIPVTLTAGTAESGDYGTLTSISIAANTTSGTGTVTTAEDADSDDETFTAALGTTLPATVRRGSADSVEVTISEKPLVSLSASPNPVNEGSPVTVTATLSEAPANAVTIPVTVTSGTAETGDHGSLTSITVAAGVKTGTGTVTTSKDADRDDETFTVALGTLPSSLAAGSASSVEVTIRESPYVSLSASPNPVGEGSSVTVTATLARALTAAVTIPLTVTSGTAESGDHGALTSISILANATTGTGAIAANQDADTEDETFTVALGSNLPAAVDRGSPASVEITIDDDELPTVTLFAVPERVFEGSSVTVIAELSSTLPTRLRVPLTVTPGTAEERDYTDRTHLTIEAGAPMGSITIHTRSDSDEDDETFTVALGSSLSASVAAGNPSSVEITIVDDEGRPTVSLSASPNPVAEGSDVTLTATLSEALAEAVTIPLQLVDDTAESDDYSAPSSIHIAAGDTFGRARIRTTEDDDADNERFTVALGELPPDVKAGNPSQLPIEISDNQADVTVTLLASSATVSEGEAVELFLRFSSPVPAPTQYGNDILVRVTGTDTETDDEDVDEGTYLIRVDEGQTVKTFTIDTNRDTDADDEHFTVEIDEDDQYDWMLEWLEIGSPSSVDITIEDGASETGSVQVSLSANLTVEEGSSADVTIKFSAPVPYQRWETVIIPLEITRIDAEPGDVQEGTINKRVSGGQTESNHFVKTYSDDDDDPDRFMVSVGTNLPAGMSAGGNSSVTITIVEYVPAESAPDTEPPGASDDVMVAVSDASPEPTFVAGASDMTVDASSAFAGEELAFELASGDAEVASFDGFSAVAPRVESVGEAAVTVAASNPGGAASVTFAATVKVVSAEEEAQGRSLDGLTRSQLAGAAGVIEKRMAASGTASPRLEHIDVFATVAGLFGRHAPSIPAGSGLASPDAGMAGFSSGLGDEFASPGELSPGGLASGSGLWNSSFAHALGSDGGAMSGLMLWGLGDVQRFGGGEGDARFDGEWRTAYLGADRRFGERWLGGVALALGRGEATYSFSGSGTGTRWLRTELTAMYPYARSDLTDGGELWAVLGAGTGTALSAGADNDEGAVQQGGLSMRLAAAGLRRELGIWSAVRLSVLADGGTAALAVRGPAALAELDSTTHRLRGGMEVAGAGRLSPYLRLNARYDGGGEMAEVGFEGESGLRYAGARVDFDLRARYMALGGNADYRESGATATLTIKAAPDGAGLTATLTPSWGRTGATDFVWASGTMPSMGTARSFTGDDAAAMFDAQLGYGIDSRRLRGRLTPTLGYRRTGPGADALRLGADYVADSAWMRRELAIGLGLQRLQTVDRAWGAELRAEMRW